MEGCAAEVFVISERKVLKHQKFILLVDNCC